MAEITLLQFDNDGDPVYFDTEYTAVGRTGKGISAPLIVETTELGRGYLKDTREVDDSDDLEIAINYLGRLLGIRMADEYRVFEHDMRIGLLSLDVACGDYNFTDMRTVSGVAWRRYSEDGISRPKWMLRWVELTRQRAYPELEDNVEFICSCDQDCLDALLLPLRIVLTLCSDGMLYSQFEEAYLSMLLFDYIIGQTDRTLDNYGLIHDTNFTFYTLAPLFDNATLSKPYLADGLCSINGMILEREHVLQALIDLKPRRVLSLITKMRNNLNNGFDRFISVITAICENPIQKDRLKSNVVKAYDRLCSLIIS